jgi:DNA-binding response OmpR family regulator
MIASVSRVCNWIARHCCRHDEIRRAGAGRLWMECRRCGRTSPGMRAGDTELHLTSLEQSLLYLLAANAGRLLTRDEILDHLWGADYVAGSNVVDRHIRNLRVKLQNHSRRPRYIATVPGRGYRFVPRAVGAPSSDSRP